VTFALNEATRRELAAMNLPPDSRVRLGVRPEHVRLVQQGGMAGTLYGAEHHGAEIIAIIQAGSHMLRATIPADSRVTVNQPLQFSFMQDKLHFFHPLTGDNLRR
jgi:ABC-type sugar transport system ATPase subunit